MSACCVNNINRHSRQCQSSPRCALTLRSLLPLTSPPPLKTLISVQMLFGKLSPIHTHGYLALLHRCCLAHVYLSPSSAFSPLLLPPSLSLCFHLLFVTNAVFLSICSFFPPVSLPHFSRGFFSPSFQTFPLCSTQIFFSLCSSISPRCFWAQTISPADAIKLKSLLRQEKYLLFGLGGPVTVIRLQPA